VFFSFTLTFLLFFIMSKLLFEDLDVYKAAHEIGKQVWVLVSNWNFFARDTLGKQLVRSADSIALNICEGYGRFHFKDKKLFYYYSRGSLYETHEALKKSFERNLISESDFESLSKTITDLSLKLNKFINSVGKGSY
jgi:four helix bundle protein